MKTTTMGLGLFALFFNIKHCFNEPNTKTKMTNDPKILN